MPLVLPILVVLTALLTTSALYRLFYVFSGRAERREYEQFKKHLNLALRDPQTAQLIYNVVMAERNRREELSLTQGDLGYLLDIGQQSNQGMKMGAYLTLTCWQDSQ